MASRPRKSSSRVTLVLLGAAALAGCGNDAPPSGALRRDLYTSREDCAADWGSTGRCEEQQVVQNDRVTDRYWYGPAYGGGWHGGTRGPEVDASHRGSRAVGSTGVARGGFGASGLSHGASAS